MRVRDGVFSTSRTEQRGRHGVALDIRPRRAAERESIGRHTRRNSPKPVSRVLRVGALHSATPLLTQPGLLSHNLQNLLNLQPGTMIEPWCDLGYIAVMGAKAGSRADSETLADFRRRLSD